MHLCLLPGLLNASLGCSLHACSERQTRGTQLADDRVRASNGGKRLGDASTCGAARAVGGTGGDAGPSFSGLQPRATAACLAGR